jgi:serine/threonine protein kinase
MLCTEEGSGALERVKILDFGIAKLGTENVSQTKSGVLMGTPAYMSPEQCRSARSAVDRSDVYALGIMMYEMLVGETPFRGGPALLMAGHMTMDPPSLAARAPSTPPELSALIHRMLAKSPSERPSAEEVARGVCHRQVDRSLSLLRQALLRCGLMRVSSLRLSFRSRARPVLLCWRRFRSLSASAAGPCSWGGGRPPYRHCRGDRGVVDRREGPENSGSRNDGFAHAG